MARLNEQSLAEITRREVEHYEGISPHAQIYAIIDEPRKRYAVTGIENEPGTNHSWIIVQAHIEDQFVVIDEDGIWDKSFTRHSKKQVSRANK
jgi:hypothetical protein